MEYNKFGKELSKLRKSKLLTQEELGNRVGVGFRAVSKWERGITFPDLSTMSQIANALGVDSSYLLDLCLPISTQNYLNKKEKSSKINLHLEKNINIYNTTTKTENDHIMKEIGKGVLIEIIIFSIINNLSIKKTISILIIGLLCISLSDIFNNKK